ncbi:phosphoribosylanthranilate isomerase [Sulfuriroseicoccus oceanibius]|uniref:N-(5'-phosphoribosyl)anthranilate isomerase n=1 Tax=Sulfuriroseicoccus oceanibius TaxID=2707525 RepID=A0A6B3LB45_9BACT|nr:phosphoribosylanthranilate isomerase [Sulfuriroseicoccus oceanibius]QQL44025.1 phosphoribosylanthranilate isomerase [Sulfuriroseicoccus oceanibius]
MAASIALLDQAPVGNSNLPAVKICGFTDLANLREIAAIDGVNAIGLNFFPKSKRYVTPATAREWTSAWDRKADGVVTVGVFVNAEQRQIIELFTSGVIDVAQLHGTESADEVSALTARGIPVIKAHGIRNAADINAMTQHPTAYHLVDAFAPGEWGGTGETVDWSLLTNWGDSHPSHRLVLSGGLKPENIAEAVLCVHPAMVDVASGVESAPGVKDANRVKTFVTAIQKAH